MRRGYTLIGQEMSPIALEISKNKERMLQLAFFNVIFIYFATDLIQKNLISTSWVI